MISGHYRQDKQIVRIESAFGYIWPTAALFLICAGLLIFNFQDADLYVIILRAALFGVFGYITVSRITNVFKEILPKVKVNKDD